METSEEKWTISDINLVINNFSILIIDDCKNIDVPLLEIQFNRLRDRLDRKLIKNIYIYHLI